MGGRAATAVKERSTATVEDTTQAMVPAMPAGPRGADIQEDSAISDEIRIEPERPQELMAQLGTVRLTRRQEKLLQELSPATPEITSIKPTGEVYVSAVHYRRVLNKIFGRLAWALRPLGPLTMDMRTGNNKSRSILYQHTGLVINQVVVDHQIGECEYHPDNARMTYGDAAAGVQSNALMRLCKNMGIFSECWDRAYGEKFRREHCVLVWLEKPKNPPPNFINKPQWRRLDQEPFYNEDGIHKNSPNRARYFAMMGGRAQEAADNQQQEPDRVAPSRERSSGPDGAETIAACKEVRPGLWCVRGSRSGDCYTNDAPTFAAAHAACHANSRIVLVTETRQNGRNKHKWIVELMPPAAAHKVEAAAQDQESDVDADDPFGRLDDGEDFSLR